MVNKIFVLSQTFEETDSIFYHYDINCGCFVDALYLMEEFLFISILLRKYFYHQWVLNFVRWINEISASIEMITGILSYVLLIWQITLKLEFYVTSTLYSWYKINLEVIYSIILSIQCHIWPANILLRVLWLWSWEILISNFLFL